MLVATEIICDAIARAFVTCSFLLQIDSMFARGAQFFALDDKVKAAVPCDPATFVGWERDAEVSPATGNRADLHMLCP